LRKGVERKRGRGDFRASKAQSPFFSFITVDKKAMTEMIWTSVRYCPCYI